MADDEKEPDDGESAQQGQRNTERQYATEHTRVIADARRQQRVSAAARIEGVAGAAKTAWKAARILRYVAVIVSILGFIGLPGLLVIILGALYYYCTNDIAGVAKCALTTVQNLLQ